MQINGIEVISEFSKECCGRKIKFYECRCFCGKVFETRKNYLISGHTKSCGCLRRQKHLKVDLTGQTFGKLKVIEFNGRDRFGVSLWNCQCECGRIITVPSQNLKSGNTTSCGCYREEHDDAKTRLYKCWQDMKARCGYEGDSNYKNYGGRGISVCNEWRNSYLAFRNWAVNNGYNDKLTIDRIDVNGNYEPSNCRWITMEEQQRNKRNTVYVFYNGEKTPLISLCESFSIDYKKAYFYLKYKGYSIEEILKREVKTL